MFQFFQTFLQKMVSSFRRISKATRNELSVEDLHSEAWLIADEISKKRGHDINFSDPDDTDLIMQRLHFRKVKRGDWNMRKAIRIDQQGEDDAENSSRWIDHLPAPASSDPLVSMLHIETAYHDNMKLMNSYSEAAAYVIVFSHFNNCRQEVSTYLAITPTTLNRRVEWAKKTVEIQSSLFDRINKIEENFMPQPRCLRLTSIQQGVKGVQWGWAF